MLSLSSHFSGILSLQIQAISSTFLAICLFPRKLTDIIKMESMKYSKQQEIPLQRKLFNQIENNPPMFTQSLRESQYQYQKPSQTVLRAEIQSLQKRLRKVKCENQELLEQAEQTRKERIVLQEEIRRTQSQFLILEELNVKQEGKLRDQLQIIQRLEEDNSKWKSYRLSEEDEARREARKYKQMTAQLENQYKKIIQELEGELRGKQVVLEEAQLVCQQLKRDILERENSYNFKLEHEKQLLNKAMDEMEAQFRSMMKDCEEQVSLKQRQLDLQRKQVGNLTLTLQEENNRVSKQIQARKEAEKKSEELVIELRNIQSEVQKMQNMSRRQSESTRVIISEAQQEVKIRYEKSIQMKVLQIQRLKLQLQEETRVSSSLARQFQNKENALKVAQRQLNQKNDRVEYLQKMVQSYEGEVRSYKKNKEELLMEINRFKDDKIVIQNLQKELGRERNKSNCLENDLSKAETIVQQWKGKYRQLIASNEKQISDSSLREKGLKNQIIELERVIQERVRSSERLQSQCQKFEKELLAGVERQKLLRKEVQNLKSEILSLSGKNANLQKVRGQQKEYIHSLLTEKNEKTNEVSSHKKYIDSMIIQQEKYVQQISELERQIMYLTSEKEQNRRQIQLLLEKIDQYQTDSLSQTVKLLHGEEAKKITRLAALEKIAKLAGIPLIEEESVIRGVTDWVYNLSIKSQGMEEEVIQYKKLVVKLRQENQSLSQKYLKYKGIVLEYKQKRDKEKLLIKNSYRFNEQILTHCQNIIKGATK